MELINFDDKVDEYGMDVYKAVVRKATEEHRDMFFDAKKPIEIIRKINARTAELYKDDNYIKRLQVEIDLGI